MLISPRHTYFERLRRRPTARTGQNAIYIRIGLARVEFVKLCNEKSRFNRYRSYALARTSRTNVRMRFAYLSAEPC